MKFVLLLLFLLAFVHGKHGVATTSPLTSSDILCLAKAGVDFVSVRAHKNDGSVDDGALATLKMLKTVGVPADMYMDSCRGIDASSQTNDMLDAIPADLYSKVWVSVAKGGAAGCDWSSYPSAGNCDYLQQMIAAINGRGKPVGIFSDSSAWPAVFKSTTGCSQVGDNHLWYAYNDHNDSFAGFKSFGAFGMPERKMYGLVDDLCNLSNIGLLYSL